MRSTEASGGHNELLRALPRRERDLVLQHCERVTLKRDEILAEPGQRIRHVYFPIDCLILLLTAVNKHDALGVGFIGKDGMSGASLVLDVSSSPLRAVVQRAGTALRMKVADLHRILIDSPNLEHQMRLYLYDLIAQLAQTTVCAAFHVVELRLAYWLLIAHDRADGDHFFLTQEVLGRVLGVRRSGVTIAAGALRRRKLISYTRGRIDILDRKGLERAACGCYLVARTPSRQAASPHAHEQLVHNHLQPLGAHTLGQSELPRLSPA